MAARSPEPAKRWRRPQSFSVSAAGRRRCVDVGDDLDRGGKAGAAASWQAEQDADDEDHPHDEQHQRAEREPAAAPLHDVGGDVVVGVNEPRSARTPRPARRTEIGVAGDDRQDGQHIEQNRQLELVAERIRDLPRAPGQFGSRSAMREGSTCSRPHKSLRRSTASHNSSPTSAHLNEQRRKESGSTWRSPECARRRV